ncbi:hypothetical protein DPV78_007400 [Talaromyces pinophilus]|nr:hypothetical protein DPV78_007400 [Talaromyces pinophilus]
MDDYYLCFVRDVASSGYSIAKSQLSALPTTSDIRECKNVLWEICTSKIVAVNDDTIVNSSASTAYDTNDDDDKKQTFLLVQHVPSVQLDSIWPSLSPSEKYDMFAQLQLDFDAMRRVGCPWPKFFFRRLEDAEL